MMHVKIGSNSEYMQKLSGNELLELINSDFLLSLLDLLHVNFSFINPEGDYIVKNNTITQEMENKTKAQEIDIQSWRDCEETMRLGHRRIVEEQYKDKYFFSIKQPVIVQGVCEGIVILSLDITERKLIERREQAALALAEDQKAKTEAEEMLRRSISIFAGSIAHDLKVPLTSMLIMTDLFTKSLNQFVKQSVSKNTAPPVENDTQLHLEYINAFPNKLKKSIVEMNSFINLTLRAMQRLATNTLSYEDFSVCEIEKCLQDVLDRYPFINKQKDLIKVHIVYNFSFLACPILFYRIIFNLLNNALSQIEKNHKGKVYISTASTQAGNVLRIKDTAGGVSAEQLSHLFEGYHSTKKKGTGVGLAFCKLTMKSFGGDITCHSVEGDYIEFELVFPKLDERGKDT